MGLRGGGGSGRGRPAGEPEVKADPEPTPAPRPPRPPPSTHIVRAKRTPSGPTTCRRPSKVEDPVKEAERALDLEKLIGRTSQSAHSEARAPDSHGMYRGNS
ncbi:unnamed protein product [Plutella xylostella]|uniref:(diamondback moth) hypothetical protein n=1 Tax=Plutella xylostella TaxID=51655 RepID=A0A8S4FFC5_PLUXY|nr:unnamed protein product [Plutella xylostella]